MRVRADNVLMALRRILVAALLPLALVVAPTLTGCAAGPVRGELHLGMEDAPEGKRLVWPAEPEVPRYLYAGTLVGEQNFKRPAEEYKRGPRALFRWLTGLDQDDQPVVLQRPGAVVGDEAGRIFVSDVSRQAVYVFDQKAGELQVWEKAEGTLSFRAPSGMALDPNGGLYVADADLGHVVHLDAKGEPLGTIGRGQLRRPTGIARDPDSGLIFVADTYAHDIKVFRADGQLVRTMGTRGTGDGEFNFPTHLAFVKGNLYVTDTLNSRIQVFGTQGQVHSRTLGERGLYVGNLVRPKGVGVDGEGNVYVIESYYDSLLIYSGSGEFLMPISGTGTKTGSFYLPSGVWVDANNRVFVADMFNGRVVVFQFLGGG